MGKIKVGLVGCGGVAQWAHIPAFKKFDSVEVVAVCDIIKERAEDAAKKVKAKHIFTDFNDLVKLEELDMVDICTPNYLHSSIAVKALQAGKHVFCEKPDAISVEQVLAMESAAKQSGKHLMVMRNNRYVGESQYAKNYIENGGCGDIYAGRCGWIRRRGIPGKGGWFTTKELSGGGPLIDLGVHMLDLAIWMMGNPTPITVSGATYNKFAANTADSDSLHADFGDSIESGVFDVEDLAMGMIRFDNGACLHVECSWASNIEQERSFVELRGDKAGLTWDWNGLAIYTENKNSIEDIKPDIKKATSDVFGHMENLRHFVYDVLIDKKEPLFKPIQGVNMIKILTALYESAKIGKEITL
ncbi:MAG: Gfo/Idh/MocA family oxidoreductase [Oscillospiraceae bacterium]|jgi:predicted dehydrogenase|nr:Gfo/Idh/MocA family oxidoreductase [Oscillospiraceae bacterium]